MENKTKKKSLPAREPGSPGRNVIVTFHKLPAEPGAVYAGDAGLLGAGTG